MGFTALFTAAMPVFICGAGESNIPSGRVLMPGLMLRVLLKEKGNTSRREGSTHKNASKRLPARLKIGRRISKASTVQPAEMLMFTIFRKISDILFPPSVQKLTQGICLLVA